MYIHVSMLVCQYVHRSVDYVYSMRAYIKEPIYVGYIAVLGS